MGKVVIVDYGMGNLFSVLQACRHAGLDAVISKSAADLHQASGAILPGVGAFGDAMANLHAAGLSEALKQVAHSGVPFFGICLGMQLLMDESHEFGRTAGLGLIEGDVVKLSQHSKNNRPLKIPHIGWDAIVEDYPGQWKGTFLEGISSGREMYFVHSFFVRPQKKDIGISLTEFGEERFCSSLQKGNIWACQYHPERSGPEGLKIYRQFAKAVQSSS